MRSMNVLQQGGNQESKLAWSPDSASRRSGRSPSNAGLDSPLSKTAMYVIHRHMRRTQLYLDEECARVLAAESRRRGTTVSALVREAVDQVYGKGSAKDRHVLIDRLAGIWSDRTDLEDVDAVVRSLRQSARPVRWGGESRGKVPARQRRRHRVASPR